MIVTGIQEKIKGLDRGEWYVITVIFLVGFGSYGLGYLSGIDRRNDGGGASIREVAPIEVVAPTPTDSAVSSEPGSVVTDTLPALKSTSGLVVGSKNSDKYHYPWCAGALRIKEENKIWFATIEEARAKGYVPAGNCKGLE